MGTGTFSSPDGATTGSVTITAAEGGFSLSLSHFATAETGSIGLSFSPYSSSTPCLADEYNLDFGDISRVSNQPGLPIGSTEGDPSFYKTVVLERLTPTPNDPAATPGGCVYVPLAFSTITWTIPDTRPDLRVVDSGTRPLAAGTVTSVNGAPTSYLVMPGDQLASIARRLGITVDDIRFLNPFDTRGLQAGQTLNLDKKLRESPPPLVSASAEH